MGKVAVGLLLAYHHHCLHILLSSSPSWLLAYLAIIIVIVIAYKSCNRHCHHHCLSCKSRFWRSVRPIILFGSLLMGRYEQLVNLISMSLDNWSLLISLKMLFSGSAERLVSWYSWMAKMWVGSVWPIILLASIVNRQRSVARQFCPGQDEQTRISSFWKNFSNLKELLKLGRTSQTWKRTLPCS